MWWCSYTIHSHHLCGRKAGAKEYWKEEEPREEGQQRPRGANIRYNQQLRVSRLLFHVKFYLCYYELLMRSSDNRMLGRVSRWMIECSGRSETPETIIYVNNFMSLCWCLQKNDYRARIRFIIKIWFFRAELMCKVFRLTGENFSR